MQDNGHVSRFLLCGQLGLGEGAIKTLIRHLKMHGLIKTSKGGTKLTDKGKTLVSGLVTSIPAEIRIPRCSIALGRFNHAVLLRELDFAVKSGIEQRDAAIKTGAVGATTLIFKDGRFVMPESRTLDCLKKESEIRRLFLKELKPEERDIVIVGSSNQNKWAAELAAKNAALATITAHEKHF